MPGLYTEPKSRAKPTNDPACDQYKITNDKNQAGAVSYAYQFHCPNDQNLIAVLGRQLTDTPVPQPPRLDRHVIPDAGACIRCNLQIQGTGVSPDDVTIDAGNTASGDGAPIGSVKDVGIRADRADGFVLDNLKVRHAKEHDIYVIETDGSHLDRFKAPYAGEYGLLTFVADHSLIENCDAWGSRRLGPLPGCQRGPRRGRPARTSAGTAPRSATATCATARSATRAPTATPSGSTTTSSTTTRWGSRRTSSPRPAIPASRRTPICSSTTTSTRTTSTPTCRSAAPDSSPGPNGPNQGCSDVVPSVPVPVGTGMWIAGGNANVVRNNRFYDNWRRGAMLFQVPDQFVCDDPDNQVAGCDPKATVPATSYRNRFSDNKMGRGSERQRPAERRGLLVGPGRHLRRPRRSTRGTAGTATRARTARRRASPARPRRAAPRRTTSRPTAPTARRSAR